MLATNALILFAGAMLGPIFALYVKEIGGDLLTASISVAVFCVAAGIAVLIAGHYADKIKENELIIVFGYAVMGFGFIYYLFVDSVPTLLIAQVIIGFGEAIYIPAFDAIYSKHLDRKKAGREWAAWESLFYFTFAIGAVAGGLVVTQFSFDAIFVIMAILCFISAGYIYFLPRKIL